MVTSENIETKDKFAEVEKQLNDELYKLSELIEKEKRDGISTDSEDFNKRGELYKLAFEVAPNARIQDLEYIFAWAKPQKGEKSIDVAAGTGMFSIPLAKITEARVYALDPSKIQLDNLNKKKCELDIITIVDSLSEQSSVEAMGEDIGNIDIITSYGGIHHALDKEENGVLINKQKEIFKNANKMLKVGGRFVAGDVGANTVLSRHFEGSVKQHCLTGHTEKWLSKERLENELLKGTNLVIVRIENVDVKWSFESERQMSLFMKGLHAYNMTDDQVLADLNTYLGYQKNGEQFELNWPMLFFYLEKK